MQAPSMDANRLYELLRKLQKNGLKPEETNELSNEILKLAGIKTIAQFNANLEAIQAKLDALAETNKAQLEALRESNQSTRRLLGIGLTIIGLIIAYGTFFTG